MITVFLRRRPAFGKVGSPGAIELDASIREVHGVHNRRTDSPLASGALVTDHVITAPDVVVIEGVVTTCPGDPVPTLSNTRHIRTWGRFVDLAKSKQPFDVITTLAIYTDMIVEDLETTRSAADGKSLIIVARCGKIQFGSVDVAQEVADVALEAALSEVDLGVQGTGAI